MTPPLFLVESVTTGDVVVDGDEGRHAATVKRLRVGETVWLGDGRGSVGGGQVSAVGRDRVTVTISSIRQETQQQQRFCVVQALARGGRDEAAVETMTEVGVDVVIGWQSARSVAQWTDKTLTKWISTTRAATKQSRRAWLPEVVGPATTSDVARRLTDASLAVVLDAAADVTVSSLVVPDAGDVVLVVGPEGGFDDRELSSFVEAGAVTARLGSGVLRSSTAGVAAISVLSANSRWR